MDAAEMCEMVVLTQIKHYTMVHKDSPVGVDIYPAWFGRARGGSLR
jgi:hypothetical protein